MLTWFHSVLLVYVFTFSNGYWIFKNCSEIDYCDRLRNNQPDASSQFSAVFSEMKINGWTLEIPLRNGKNQNLTLTIYFLQDNKVRIKIREPDSKRFELKSDWSLNGEPTQVNFRQTNLNNNSFAFYPADDPKSYQVLIFEGPPFIMEFYENSNLQVVLNSKRFVMENTEDSQAFAFAVEFASEKLYGLFDHAWDLTLSDTLDADFDPFRLMNTDPSGYPAHSTVALYSSIPAIYGHSTDRTGGIFLHNAAEQWVDIFTKSSRPSAYFMVESASFDLFVLMGPTPKQIVRQFTDLTGKAPLPQLWTLGYHQCHFSYSSQEDVKNVANLMYQNRFPVDAIWLDGDHTDGYRWFRWNHTTFTDPVEMLNNVSSLNKVCVSISDPHIKVEDEYDVYAGGKGKFFVQWENGTDWQDICWPGLASWINFLDIEASDYYSSWYSYDKFKGTTPTLAGIWNDMNEPSVFNKSTENTAPFDIVHKIDSDGNTVRHGDVHNIYGMMHNRATYQGLLNRDNFTKRPFILTRSTFAGSQRAAAVWTGDNTASWEHFAVSLAQCMTGSILGTVFCGADIGGFHQDPTDELLQRWYQGAVWLTFFRGHSDSVSKRREPYLLPKDVQDVIRDALELRYKHIPFLYQIFYEHTRTGDPIISPLFYKYPGVHGRDTQILVGEDIMAVGVVNPSVSSVDVLFPGTSDEVWYRIDDDSWKVSFGDNTKTQKVDVDIKSSPVFYRGGSIITRKEMIRQSTFDSLNDKFTFYVNLDKNGQASGRFYMDDFTSFQYQTHSQYLYLSVIYDSKTEGIVFEVIDGEGDAFNPQFASIVVHSVSESSGKYKSHKKTFESDRNGKKLAEIEIGKEIKTSKRYVIRL